MFLSLDLGYHLKVKPGPLGKWAALGILAPASGVMAKRADKQRRKKKKGKKARAKNSSSSSSSETQDLEIAASAAAFGLKHACNGLLAQKCHSAILVRLALVMWGSHSQGSRTRSAPGHFGHVLGEIASSAHGECADEVGR